MELRTGRKVGRTIYLQEGPEPTDDDMLVAVADTPELAALFVYAVRIYTQKWPSMVLETFNDLRSP